MKVYTVKELCEVCKELIDMEFGDYKILVSSDEEGNDFHELIYLFTALEDDVKEVLKHTSWKDKDVDNYVILG